MALTKKNLRRHGAGPEGPTAPSMKISTRPLAMHTT
jgi:hypothetical protein